MVKSPPSYDQSELNLSLVASCFALVACFALLALLALLLLPSCPFIVRITQLSYHVKVSLSSASFSMFTTAVGNCLFLFLCLFVRGSLQVVECGGHGQ